jgi:GNAT superfamily N-acetyltransferase
VLPLARRAAALGIAYRPATDDDLKLLAEVYASTRWEEVAQTGWPMEAQRQFLEQQFRAQHLYYREHYTHALWLVIEQSGEPVGRLYIDTWRDEVRLVDISLLPAVRGSGIGGAILEDLQEQAAEIGKPLTIHVERNNPAMRLYRRLGFEPIDEHGVYLLMEWRPESAPASDQKKIAS